MNEPRDIELLLADLDYNGGDPLTQESIQAIRRLRAELERAQNDLVASVKTKVDWLKQLEQAVRERDEAQAMCEGMRQTEIANITSVELALSFELPERAQELLRRVQGSLWNAKAKSGQPLLDRLAALIEALTNLVNKLHECEPHINAACIQTYGGHYTGPNYGEELKAAEEALSVRGQKADGRMFVPISPKEIK